MSYFKNFIILALLIIPIHSVSDEKIEQSKYFVENLGKEVVEKVSNVNLTESERNVNFRNLYLNSLNIQINCQLFVREVKSTEFNDLVASRLFQRTNTL